jgi:hypothetical protein
LFNYKKNRKRKKNRLGVVKMNKCHYHDNLVVDVKELKRKVENHGECIASIKSDVSWLVTDRKEQKKAYYEKNAWKNKVRLAIAGIITSMITVLFTSEEACNTVKEAVKRWLDV